MLVNKYIPASYVFDASSLLFMGQLTSLIHDFAAFKRSLIWVPEIKRVSDKYVTPPLRIPRWQIWTCLIKIVLQKSWLQFSWGFAFLLLMYIRNKGKIRKVRSFFKVLYWEFRMFTLLRILKWFTIQKTLCFSKKKVQKKILDFVAGILKRSLKTCFPRTIWCKWSTIKLLLRGTRESFSF